MSDLTTRVRGEVSYCSKAKLLEERKGNEIKRKSEKIKKKIDCLVLF